ncbi:conjugal transfer protein [Streptococcus anginosus]|nr:conjugal transfer protein [Streptococcus anginosus]
MNTVKLIYHQLKTYLGNFTKRPKKKGKPTLTLANKKTVNLAVLSGLAFILLVGLLGGIRAMTMSSKVTNLEKLIATKKATSSPSSAYQTIDNRLQYYLNDFVECYFTIPADSDGQTKQAKQLTSFYGSEPDIQAQGQVKNPSQLSWSRLLTVTDNVATYEVHYKQTVKNGDKTEEKELVTGFNIPYAKTKTGYYVTGLPWFSSLSTNQADKKSTDTEVKLNQSDRVSEKTKKKLDKFLNVFFTNYTTDQDNLDLVAHNVTVVKNATFKTLDFSYYKVTDKAVMAYVQVTFEVAGSTHAENFTLTLSEKGKSYYMEKVSHTIPANYADTKE